MARIQRQQLLREAEGYLDLLMVFADQWPPSEDVRDRLAVRALNTLDQIDDPGLDLGHLFYLRGQALRTMERYDEAAQILRDAADFLPDNVHVWLALAWCYKRLHRVDLAIESLEEALTVEPGEAIIHYNLACYWSLAENVEQSIFHLSQAFDIDTNYRDLVGGERDFDPIRRCEEFQMITSIIV